MAAQAAKTDGKEENKEDFARPILPLSNRPFECCIKEYGVPVGDDSEDEDEEDSDGDVDMDGQRKGGQGGEKSSSESLEFRRNFRLFGTTIM